MCKTPLYTLDVTLEVILFNPLSVASQVLKNPIVFMVIVGIISHFALGQQIPAVLSQFIDGLANSFGGAALFYLGLTMVVFFLFCSVLF